MKKVFSVIKFILLTAILAGCSSTQTLHINNDIYNTHLSTDTIHAGKFDTGKMWTFEYPPLDHFKAEYDFLPDEEWFDKVRLAALRFSTYCSASFVSEDGLIMTNNHCARESAVEVSREGEDLQQTGFYAETPEDERQVPGLFVDQLVFIKDVTDEVYNAIESAETVQEKLHIEEKIISEIEKRVSDSTGLSVSITPLYNGGRYSLYGYKRYNDVRLVFTPEHLLGHFGGEYDNFTYPRYNLDFAFFRVYEDGKPLKTENYFKWNPEGAKAGEAVFVIGNPGSTNRLLTAAQLEYLRDVLYPKNLQLYSSLVELYRMITNQSDSTNNEAYVQYLKYLNAEKVYKGMLEGLNNPVLMQRKRDFERQFKSKVQADKNLNEKYGNIWDKIEQIQREMRLLDEKIDALTVDPDSSAIYFFVAQDLVDLADELKLPEDQRVEYYKDVELDTLINTIIPEDYEHELNKKLLVLQLQKLIDKLGYDNQVVKKITAGKNAEDTAEFMLANSVIDEPQKLREIIKKGPDEILNMDDQFIYFVINSTEQMNQLELQSIKISDDEEVYTQMLGKALFEVYGTSIPPDATFTLRISDGVVKGYPYNGTIAPPFTTYYGMYERYYAFDHEYPWDLPEKWINPPAEFDLSTPLNFVSTNDITGGSSGSAVVNKNGELVGIAFDGNIQSLAGNFIYTEEENRMVSVHSAGIIEALVDIYKSKRLAYELLSGKLAEEIKN